MNRNAKDLEHSVREEISKVIVGKEEQIRLIVAAVLAEGHILLDDLPGVGKTTLVKCLARTLGCDSGRIQFTPDMLPSDIIGMNIFDRSTGEFKRLEGPVVTNLLLADELNRAIPRTQSALLEAMEERQITIDGESSPLPRSFCVLATQNPVESESTFRLPAAQTDRFMICLSLGYPSVEEEVRMLKLVGDDIPFEDLKVVTNREELTELGSRIAKEVKVTDELMAYIASVTDATRKDPALKLGASPRATRALYKISKCHAAICGREYVIPDDVHKLAPYVLCHRFMMDSRAALEGRSAEDVLMNILNTLPVPPLTKEIFDE
ncbi:MAG: MoxR family ATPase [Lachnospiraceae bacterium]|nr:MoxR family ATPase [Lachnospiraceae bacterium]